MDESFAARRNAGAQNPIFFQQDGPRYPRVYATFEGFFQ